jgi:hypothetical protein
MTKPKTPALDGLEKKAQAVEQARERVSELEEEARNGKRELDRAIGPLQDYYRALGDGAGHRTRR